MVGLKQWKLGLREEKENGGTGAAGCRLAVAVLSRAPMPPVRFVAAAHRLLGDGAAAAHGGLAAAPFSYRLGDEGESLLVAWGEAADLLGRKAVPSRTVVVPLPPGAGGRRVAARVRHLTPTLLKRRGGPRVPWFDAEGYAAALAGALRAAGLDVSPADVARAAEVLGLRTRLESWDLGCGVERGFVGEVALRLPAAWAEALRVASLTGLGCKRAWGMGNVEVAVG